MMVTMRKNLATARPRNAIRMATQCVPSNRKTSETRNRVSTDIFGESARNRSAHDRAEVAGVGHLFEHPVDLVVGRRFAGGLLLAEVGREFVELGDELRELSVI